MAIESGYSRYACDRAERAHKDGKLHAEFLRPEDKRVADWHQIQWFDENGILRTMEVCQECWEKVESIQITHARDMAEFENEGR